MSDVRIVSEWLAQELADEAAEDAARAAELSALPDPFDDDFGTGDPVDRMLYGLITGERPATTAEELEVDLADLEAFKRQALERATVELPGLAEQYALIEAGLTEVTRRAYIGLGEAMPGERSDLLNVLIGVYRARIEALQHHPHNRKA